MKNKTKALGDHAINKKKNSNHMHLEQILQSKNNKILKKRKKCRKKNIKHFMKYLGMSLLAMLEWSRNILALKII